MNYKYTWKRGLLSSTYFIFYNDEQIGYIKHSLLKRTVSEINGKTYTFKPSGILKRDTKIIDDAQRRTIGKMKYNIKFSKARVSLDNKTVYWKYRNIFRFKWKIHDARGLKIKYKSSLIKGNITANTEDDDIPLLSGLYLAHNHFLILVLLFIITILFFNYYEF